MCLVDARETCWPGPAGESKGRRPRLCVLGDQSASLTSSWSWHLQLASLTNSTPLKGYIAEDVQGVFGQRTKCALNFLCLELPCLPCWSSAAIFPVTRLWQASIICILPELLWPSAWGQCKNNAMLRPLPTVKNAPARLASRTKAGLLS